MSTRLNNVVALLLVLLVCSPSLGQIIYEPIRTQFGGQNPYRYGGADWRVQRLAAAPCTASDGWGRARGFSMISKPRLVIERRERVFVDALPGYDASRFGYDASAAHNDSMARLPTYYRKSDLLDAARHEGTQLIVPSHVRAADDRVMPRGGTIVIRRTSASAPRGPVLVFPKRLLDQPINPGRSGTSLTACE